MVSLRLGIKLPRDALGYQRGLPKHLKNYSRPQLKSLRAAEGEDLRCPAGGQPERCIGEITTISGEDRGIAKPERPAHRRSREWGLLAPLRRVQRSEFNVQSRSSEFNLLLPIGELKLETPNSALHGVRFIFRSNS